MRMETLRQYLNSLSTYEQAAFAVRCGTTLNYLRKALSKGQKLGEALCINLERESQGVVICEELRPDVDWAFLRGTVRPQSVRSSTYPGFNVYPQG